VHLLIQFLEIGAEERLVKKSTVNSYLEFFLVGKQKAEWYNTMRVSNEGNEITLKVETLKTVCFHGVVWLE